MHGFMVMNSLSKLDQHENLVHLTELCPTYLEFV